MSMQASRRSHFRDNLRSKRLNADAQSRQHPAALPRAKILARCLMLSSMPAQLRFAFGAAATNAAVISVSDILENPALNRRLCYVLLERVLVTIFPDNSFRDLFTVLHSKSPRAARH